MNFFEDLIHHLKKYGFIEMPGFFFKEGTHVIYLGHGTDIDGSIKEWVMKGTS
jgi:hypothetical protein